MLSSLGSLPCLGVSSLDLSPPGTVATVPGGLLSFKGMAPNQSRAAPAWRAWYNTARWAALRLTIFLRDMYQCRDCGKVEGNTSLLVCDHIIPHRGEAHLFWDEHNLQTLCKKCHDTNKQRAEQATLHERGVWH